MKVIIFAQIFVLCIGLTIAIYTDSVLPARLQEPYESNPGNRAQIMEKNIRLMAVMDLMQQDWQLYKQHWYRLFELELMWVPAENFCRQLGGHLVSVRDAAENDFVHALRKKNNIWIGLNKLSSRFYTWSDSNGTSAPEYLNWDSTQPNEPNVHCVYMAYNQDHQTGTWFDYGCHQKLPQYFVCKLFL